ncbi:MAG: hypothetical protein QXP66_00980 [Candidatus Aenigmatarchaeota archaeon]
MSMSTEELIKLLEEANEDSVRKTAERSAIIDDIDTKAEEFGKKAAEAFLENIKDAFSKRADNINPMVTTDTGPSEPEPNPASGETEATHSEDELSELINQVTGTAAESGTSTQVGGSAKIDSPSVDIEKVVEETAQKILSEQIVDNPEAAATIARAMIGAPAEIAKLAETYKNLGRLYARNVIARIFRY